MRFTNRLLLSVLIGCVTAALLAVSPPANANTTPSKNDAQALYNKIAAAFKKKDSKAVEALATPNVVNKTSDGKTLTRDEWIKSLDANLKIFTTVDTAVFTISRVKMAGENLIVDNSLHLGCTIADPNGKPHKMNLTSMASDTWTKSKGKWLLLIQKDLPGTKTLLDGKPFPPSAPK